MCDCIVAVADETRIGATIFGKNSDRSEHECQPFRQFPGAFHAPGSSLPLHAHRDPAGRRDVRGDGPLAVVGVGLRAGRQRTRRRDRQRDGLFEGGGRGTSGPDRHGPRATRPRARPLGARSARSDGDADRELRPGRRRSRSRQVRLSQRLPDRRSRGSLDAANLEPALGRTAFAARRRLEPHLAHQRLGDRVARSRGLRARAGLVDERRAPRHGRGVSQSRACPDASPRDDCAARASCSTLRRDTSTWR